MHELKANNYIQQDENITIVSRKVRTHVMCHTHDFFELSYIAGGKGIQIVNTIEYNVSRGDLLIFNIGDSHEVLPSPELSVVNILLKPEFVSNELAGSYDALDILMLTSFDDFRIPIETMLPKLNFSGKNLIEFEQLLNNMSDEFNSKEAGYKTMLRSFIHILFVRIFRYMSRSKTDENKNGVFRLAPQILQYIEDNYHRKISLHELARECFYNPSYFGQLFKECFGQTPTEFIAQKRLEKAKLLLEEENNSIESISQSIGFKDLKQFYKLFKDYTGITPAEYRKNSRNNPL